MRSWLVVGRLLAIALPPTEALAVPRVEIRGAAAHVVVIPEMRTDIAVTVIKANPVLPLKVTRFGDATFVDGNVGHRVHGCPSIAGKPGVRIKGLGRLAGDGLPQLAIHTPMDVRITAGEGVSGAIGRSVSLDLENRGCGTWTIANVRDRIRLEQIGPGEARAGRAGAADLNVAGSGAIATRALGGALTAVSSGNGTIQVESVEGPVVVRIAGSGNVGIRAGVAPQLNVSIAGSGAARFGGAVGRLTASVAGPGFVSVTHVSGPVSRHVFGAGEIMVGR